MTKNGIDVSEWQGDINWSSVAANGVDFCMIRAGYGREVTQKDKKFEANYAGCKSAGIPCGIYWYSYATTPEDAKKEAAACLEVIKGKQFEYPIFFDVEEQKQLSLGKAAVSNIIRAFLEEVEKAGYWVGLYMSASPLTTHVDDNIKTRYAIWVAHYGVSKPSYSGKYGMWQKSSTGSVAGIAGNVDLNEAYIDYPTEVKAAGLNGFKAPTVNTPATPKPTVQVTLTIDDHQYSGLLTED